MLRIAAACSIATVFTLGAAVPRADACSQPQSGWQVYSQEAFQSDVPTQGLLLIHAYYFSYGTPTLQESLQYVTIEVFDRFENQVAGTTEYSTEAGGFLFRSVQNLEAGATYFVRYAIDHVGWSGNVEDWRGVETGGFTFSTRTTPLAALVQPGLEDLELREARRGKQVCCDMANEHLVRCLEPCGFGGSECQACWDESYTYRPYLETVWSHSASPQELIRATAYRRTADGQREQISTAIMTNAGEAHFSSEFETGNAYCIQLELERLADGATATSDWACGEEEDLQILDRDAPDFSQVAFCAELPEGYDINGPIKKEKKPDGKLKPDATGCTCLALNDVAPAGALLGLLPLLVGWRRRRAHKQ